MYVVQAAVSKNYNLGMDSVPSGQVTLNYTLVLQLTMAENKELPSEATKKLYRHPLGNIKSKDLLLCISMDHHRL
jgi:hypothetical protein